MNINNLKLDKSNLLKIAIVCVGYNRIKSMKRLLGSLLNAQYPSNDIPLVISIDCSGNEELYDFILDFKWPYGKKYVNIQSERLGLKDHIYKCGDLTEYFKAIILLEDDLFVSPYFYSYTLQTLEKYGADDRIAQISLYKNERNGYVGLPVSYVQNGSDVLLMQDVSTWGECWNKLMWDGFKAWRDSHIEDDIYLVDMPDAIKNWTRAWSKYYNAYVVDTNKYVLYPNIAVTTNFSDAGEHGGDNNSIVQVNLLQRNFDYRLFNYEDLVKYDIFFNNEDIYDWLGLRKEDVCLDLYGFHKNLYNRRYILSTKILPFSTVKSFALHMRPIELNIKYNIQGMGIFLYDTKSNVNIHKNGYRDEVVPYFLKGFNEKLLFKYIVKACLHVLWKKIRCYCKR